MNRRFKLSQTGIDDVREEYADIMEYLADQGLKSDDPTVAGLIQMKRFYDLLPFGLLYCKSNVQDYVFASDKHHVKCSTTPVPAGVELHIDVTTLEPEFLDALVAEFDSLEVLPDSV